VRRDLGPLRLWRTLWTQFDEFLGSEGKSPSERPRRRGAILRMAARAFRVTAATVTFAHARNGRALESAQVIDLPVRGDLALVRRSGAVKVLDLAQDRVVTFVRGDDARSRLTARLQHTEQVAGTSFAPRVVAVDLDHGWFAEEFIRGSHPTGFRGCFDGFDEHYLPLLSAILRTAPPRQVVLAPYGEGLAAEILSPEGLLTRLPADDRERVRTFVTATSSRLAAWPQLATERLPLALSHGDFFSGNVVVPRRGSARAIDWANMGCRSPMHDLYYLLMNHCSRVMTPRQRQERLPAMLDALRARLSNEDPKRFAELDGALSTSPVYRWIFYLECIQVPLERCDDPDDRYIAAMLERVSWFQEHERAVATTEGREDTA
jgi:hypothetical protein